MSNRLRTPSESGHRMPHAQKAAIGAILLLAALTPKIGHSYKEERQRNGTLDLIRYEGPNAVNAFKHEGVFEGVRARIFTAPKSESAYDAAFDAVGRKDQVSTMHAMVAEVGSEHLDKGTQVVVPSTKIHHDDLEPFMAKPYGYTPPTGPQTFNDVPTALPDDLNTHVQ
jgi:hypothetical protein